MLPRSIAARAGGLVSPLPTGLVEPLIRSLAHDTVATGHHVAITGRTAVDEAMRLAVRQIGAAATMPGDPWWVGADLPETLVRGTVEVLGLRSLLDPAA